MIRDIKFKAKRVDNGEWVEGDLLHKYWIRGDEFIETAIRYLIGDYYSFPIPVHPETVCQFTGQYDDDGVKIYECDILSVKGGEFTYNVLFESGSFVCYHVNLKTHAGEKLRWGLLSRAFELDFKNFIFIVTGNIHDQTPADHV